MKNLKRWFYYNLEDIIKLSTIIIVVGFLVYIIVGTKGNVSKIKELAPKSISERGWKILRYEGYQYGSCGNHGGKVWYHVCNIDNPNIQYRIYITLWDDELQYCYGRPEVLEILDVNIKK